MACQQILARNMRTREIIQQPADPPRPDNGMQAIIDFRINSNPQFFRNGEAPLRIAIQQTLMCGKFDAPHNQGRTSQ